ncbi:hypothetical protein JTB14_033497 [Gonioctena quinquepunctata]|nr:hypothetical protein JTB14_033497 [Gonioctena quinquepunctata]
MTSNAVFTLFQDRRCPEIVNGKQIGNRGVEKIWGRQKMTGRVGYLKASKTFHVPQSTLEDRVRKAKQQNTLQLHRQKEWEDTKVYFQNKKSTS